MTLETSDRLVIYRGNGAAVEFPFGFIIPTGTQKVSLQDYATSEILEVLAPGSYTILGLDDPDGGKVTYPLSGPPLTSAYNIVIEREVEYKQSLDIPNYGGFSPGVLMDQLDRIVMQTQQLAELVSRAVSVPVGVSGALVSAEPNKVIGWNSEKVISNLDPEQFVNIAGYASAAQGAKADTAVQPSDLTYVTPQMFGAVGDGVTDDTAQITAAVAYALAEGVAIDWPAQDFVTTSSIPDFHSVKHVGFGRVLRGTDIWYITPRGDQRNIIHVGSPNLNANDGFSAAESTNISQAFNRMKAIGEKAQDGRWRIQIHGTLTSSGVSRGDFPAFRNRLEIWGDEVAMNAEPTSVWNGTSSVSNYAIRIDWSYNTANVFLHFRNIKFINWNNSALAGAIVVWASGDVLAENIWTDNCAVGLWFRQNYSRIVYGSFKNAQTYGVQVSYGASANVGSLLGGGVLFENCAEGVSVGRQTTCYIQGNTFTNNGDHISCTRNSRIRTQGNTFNAWTNSVVYLQNVGVWTNDNGQGSPDTYAGTPEDAKPVLRCLAGSVHPDIHRYDGGLNTYNLNSSLVTITNTNFNLLSNPATGAVNGDFIAARLPSWWAYSPSASLRLRIWISLSANAGGTFYLHGDSPNASARLAEITIPAIANARSGWLEVNFFRRFGASSGRYTAEFRSASQTIFASGSSASLSNSAIRAAVDATLAYRLYWQSVTTDQVLFVDMKTWIEA